MIYTAEKFAAFVATRGATVTTTTDGPLTVVNARYNGVRTHAWFGPGGRFRDAAIHPNKTPAEETVSLKQVVEALGLPCSTIKPVR
jgi:formylmethanofuran dehydrogenase subunit A